MMSVLSVCWRIVAKGDVAKDSFLMMAGRRADSAVLRYQRVSETADELGRSGAVGNAQDPLPLLRRQLFLALPAGPRLRRRLLLVHVLFVFICLGLNGRQDGLDLGQGSDEVVLRLGGAA